MGCVVDTSEMIDKTDRAEREIEKLRIYNRGLRQNTERIQKQVASLKLVVQAIALEVDARFAPEGAKKEEKERLSSITEENDAL